MITLWKNSDTKSDEMEPAPGKKTDIPVTHGTETYLKMEKEIMESGRPLDAKILMIWSALTLLKKMGELDDETVNSLFCTFIFRELGLEDGPA